MPTMMMTTIMAAMAGTKYMSATDVGVAVGAVVAEGCCITVKDVSADDP